jgi:uncharacterized protein YkwD
MHRTVSRSFLIGALALGLIGLTPGLTTAQVSLSEQTVMLAAHNQLRQSVAAAESARLGQTVTIPDLTWNADAATVAQAWADHMLSTNTFEHNANRGPFGENIYWESGNDPSTSAARAFASWAAEQANYTWDTNACSAVCGHYTQIVWAATTSVGCGMATDGTQDYWVCDYAPAGNFEGQRPYEPGAATGPVTSTSPVEPVASTQPAATEPPAAPPAATEPPAATVPPAAPPAATEPPAAPAESPAG